MTSTVALTGVTGFIGTYLSRAFRDAGWRVVGLCRIPEQQTPLEGVSYRPFDLHDASSVDLTGVDTLIHCAVEPYRRANAVTESVNVSGSRALFESARTQGVRKIVFMSSTTSRVGTRSPYGLDKFAVEGLLESARDIVIRPGLVVGDGGLFRAMYRSIRKVRAAPLFSGGGQPVYAVGIHDLTAAILRLVERDAAGTYVLAASEPVTMKSMYKRIARKAGVRVRLISLPYGLMLLALGLTERFGLTLPISTGSMKGVANMQRVDVPDYRDLGITIQPFSAALDAVEFSVE